MEDSWVDPFPDYDNPPLVETVLGVQFNRLPGFKNAHLGAFWKTLGGTEWPSVADANTILPQFERFSEEARWAKGLQIHLTQDPACRLKIRNKDNDRMIQVQNGRFHFNWLGHDGGGYPRYEKVRDGFDWAVRRFIEFVDQEQVGDFRPNQWEVTYINDIPRGTVWNSPDDWKFFKLLAVPTIENLVKGEDFRGEWHFQIPEQRGRLHVGWRLVKKRQDESVRLTLTARGPVEIGADRLAPIFDGFSLGRAAIVRSFKNFMSDKANKEWGLKHAND